MQILFESDIWIIKVKKMEENDFRSILEDFRVSLREDLSRDTKSIISEEVSQIVNLVKKNASDITSLRKENENLKETIVKQAITLENFMKRNNLIIFGFKDAHNETHEELVNNVKQMLRTQLEIKIEDHYINQIRRLGNFVINKNILILLSLTSGQIKNDILKQRSRLKGTDIFINNDLGREMQLVNKKLRIMQRELRSAGLRALVKGGGLLINEKYFTVQEIENTGLEEVISLVLEEADSATTLATQCNEVDRTGVKKRGRPTGSTNKQKERPTKKSKKIEMPKIMHGFLSKKDNQSDFISSNNESTIVKYVDRMDTTSLK